MIEIDGQDGGGQILRTALSLSAHTGKKFRMRNIRGRRRKAGLMRQHLTCVKACAEICSATVDGADMGSREIVFSPVAVQPGDYEYKIGSAGSTTLLLQTLLPPLLFAKQASNLRLHGGTHNPMAPTADFLQHSFLPQLKAMGASIEFCCDRIGFAPAGGGCISARIEPVQTLQGLDLIQRGRELSQKIEILSGNIRASIVKDEIKHLSELIQWPDSCYHIREENRVDGSGNVVVLEKVFEQHVMHVSSFGEMRKSAAKVASDAAKAMLSYLNGPAAIGPRLADQLLLPLALAGKGSLSTTALTNHMQTNIQVIEQFMSVKFHTSTLEQGETLVKLHDS